MEAVRNGAMTAVCFSHAGSMIHSAATRGLSRSRAAGFADQTLSAASITDEVEVVGRPMSALSWCRHRRGRPSRAPASEVGQKAGKGVR